MPKAAKPAPPQEPTAPLAKIDILIAALQQPDGASLDELMQATGWQRHSVRGALAGIVFRKLGSKVLSEKTDGVRRYKAPTDAG